MSRETAEYVVGDFWLDKRRDGKAPDTWQIAWYDGDNRSVRYRSTRCKRLDDAKAKIHAHDEASRSKRLQSADAAKVVPQLFLYWDEHGKRAMRPDTIAGSLRAFIGFLLQDTVGADVTFDQLNPLVFKRFIDWRMKPHSYSVPWAGRTIATESKGVRGESVRRNLQDVGAALNHAAGNGRVPYAPKMATVPAGMLSPPRDRVLSRAELGAIFGYARGDDAMFRFLALILATTIRTEAANKFDPAAQFDPERKLIDLHPKGQPRTKKHNPVVPAIPAIIPVLQAWKDAGSKPIRSRKTAWRTLRRALGLGPEVEPKTIRHTVATRLRGLKVPPQDVESVLGHRIYKGSSAVYAKYDPSYLAKARSALSKVWADTMAAADEWGAVHSRSTPKRGRPITIDRRDEKAEKSDA